MTEIQNTRFCIFIVGLAASTHLFGCATASDRSSAINVSAYADEARQIREAVMRSNDAYADLAELCDEYGPRLSGSVALERAIDWAQQKMKADGLANVRAEPVMVPKWVRGEERLTLVAPHERPIEMLGLGGSVGTPPGGIEAEVLVVPSIEKLRELGHSAAKGKIVLFNYPMKPYDPETGSGYGDVVRYRGSGAMWAAEAGAVAALVRSVTAYAFNAPHTGAMRYADSLENERIPTAAIAIEDAESMARLQARGVPVRVRLEMGARDEGMVPSANVIGEIVGREKPEEIVIISGHFDSWDVGHGAHDDGGPCVSMMEAAAALKRLNLVPRRTIRVVLWTNEENGLRGARQYVEDHADELANHVAAIESDAGIFEPQGFSVQYADKDRQQRAATDLAGILRLLKPLGATQARAGFSGADVGQLAPGGAACLGLSVDGAHYFDYHHSHADTFDKIDKAILDKHVAAVATLAYILADMPGRLGDESSRG
ncbi:MAG: M20/M25/M40 family metallo-hydrolase [Phycisphaerae bacterium]